MLDDIRAQAQAAIEDFESTGGAVFAERIKAVDGAGSGIDADLLDGQHGSYYASASHTHTLSALGAQRPSLPARPRRAAGPARMLHSVLRGMYTWPAEQSTEQLLFIVGIIRFWIAWSSEKKQYRIKYGNSNCLCQIKRKLCQ